MVLVNDRITRSLTYGMLVGVIPLSRYGRMVRGPFSLTLPFRPVT